VLAAKSSRAAEFLIRPAIPQTGLVEFIRRRRSRRTEAPPEVAPSGSTVSEDPYQAYLAWVNEGRPALRSEPRTPEGAIAVGVAPRPVTEHVQIESSAEAAAQVPRPASALARLRRFGGSR
jgi:hypothetical protein